MPEFAPVELLMLGLLALNLVIGLLFVKSAKGKSGKDKNADRIAAAIRDYFRRSGVEVSVGCVALDGSKQYTAFVESEPMKRFRLSHIIEATLAEHVQKTCKLELDKIYWRFPIKEGALLRAEPQSQGEAERPAGTAGAAAAGKPAAPQASPVPAAPAKGENDDYINEGLSHYKHLPKVEAEEMSWEKFQEMQASQSSKT